MKTVILGDAANPHTQKWSGYFSSQGYDVHLISFQPGQIEGVTVHHIPTPGMLEISPVAPLRAKFGYLFCLRSIRKLIKLLQPDVLHAHWATSYGLAGALSGYHPYIISTWGRDVTDSPQESWLMKKILEYNLSKADAVTATSRMLADETAKYEYNGKTIHHIPFGVDLSLFPLAQEKKIKSRICIGTVKALEEKYGIEYLIRAFAIAKSSEHEIRLLIVGDGSLKDQLKELVVELDIVDSVEFAGRVPNNEVINYLHQIDIFVVPSISKSETFGVAAVEASACALPIIASDIGGLPEVVRRGETGFLIPPKNIEILTEQILILVRQPDLRQQLGRAGRKFVQEKYTLEECGARIEKIYHQLALVKHQ